MERIVLHAIPDNTALFAMADSPDYKERFKAEIFQLTIRYSKLEAMLKQHEAGTLGFKPTCPVELLKRQLEAMGQYLSCLETRAAVEKIDLDEGLVEVQVCVDEEGRFVRIE